MKIGFILLSNSRHPQPSTRIAALNMFPYLRAAGWQPDIVFEPEQGCEQPDLSGLSAQALAGYQVIVFQKVHGPSAERLARELGAAGIATVYSVCDLVQPAMAAATDATAVISRFLQAQYPAALQPRIHVVHDGIEDTGLCKQAWWGGRGGRLRPLRAVLVTSAELDHLPQVGVPPPWLTVQIVGRYVPLSEPFARLRASLRQLRRQPTWAQRLRCLAFNLHPRIERTAWSPQAVAEALLQADLALLPIDAGPPAVNGVPPAWQLKSANRLTLKMCAGLPVISTPIPAYEEVLEHGSNGFFARDRAGWLAALTALRDPELRRSMGARARASVVARYSSAAQADRLLALLDGLQRPSQAPYDNRQRLEESL